MPRANPDGRIESPPIFKTEYDTWFKADNHARAYRVLSNERSVAIAKKLPAEKTEFEKSLFPDPAVDKDGKPLGYKPAYENERCLACHSTLIPTNTQAQGVPALKAAIRDGVSCESCHGASDQWLSIHTTPGKWKVGWSANPDFQRANVASKAQSGMICNDDLVTRAKNCAGCHVGAAAGTGGIPLRDVDHDLIAAGHPRLDFELSSFLATLGDEKQGPNVEKHWRVARLPDGLAPFPAHLWAIGQVASARAALELLADRATRAQAKVDPSPWVEFTEFDCFSCHHDLANPSWRRELASTPVSGRARWGTWHYPMLEVLAAAEAGNPNPNRIPAALTQLKAEMLLANPDPSKVVGLANTAATELGSWLDELGGGSFDAARVERLLTTYKDLQKPGILKSWDEATQRYLALVPLGQAYGSLTKPGAPPDPAWSAELQKLRDHLAFPKDFDSPKGFDPGKLPATP